MIKPVYPNKVIVYQDHNGNEPFTDWLNNLNDRIGRKRILTRLRRLEEGNYGDYVRLSEGIYELRMFFGPGYRVYFGEDDDHIVVLLCGGDKSSQKKDIKAAIIYWNEYKNHAQF